MTSRKTSRALELRVGTAGDALDRFEAAWNRVAEGRAMAPLRVLTVASLPLLLKALTPARWGLLEGLSRSTSWRSASRATTRTCTPTSRGSPSWG